MRIVFLCGCLEIGRDGVGDYTRRLACELISQGHMCCLISMNDWAVDFEVDLVHVEEQEGIAVLRLAREGGWARRIEVAREWIREFAPTWISLQFVPYSFHPKGLPALLGRRLKQMVPEGRWHVMFHELWIGINTDSAPKERIVGGIQCWLIRKLMKTLRPQRIHTQTVVYQTLLERENSGVTLLPLFGNIPVTTARKSILPCLGVRLIAFGGIHPGAPIEDFAREAAAYAIAKSTSVQLDFVGRCGIEKDFWLNAWRSVGLPFNDYGSCAPKEVSAHLAAATHGIATTPAVLLGKSGSAAAMREHQLPVISVSRPWQPRGIEEFSLPPGFARYEHGNFEACLNAGAGLAATPEQIVAQFLRDLAFS